MPAVDWRRFSIKSLRENIWAIQQFVTNLTKQRETFQTLPLQNLSRIYLQELGAIFLCGNHTALNIYIPQKHATLPQVTIHFIRHGYLFNTFKHWNSSRPRQINCSHFTGDIFVCVSLTENATKWHEVGIVVGLAPNWYNSVHSHTHTNTHKDIYIYIYIYIHATLGLTELMMICNWIWHWYKYMFVIWPPLHRRVSYFILIRYKTECLAWVED